ncbi:MAG TPA: acetate--CoA ligase family protein [Hyphomicrobiaceae bacterium]|nr:acetate--CoA ligase family protein [Hyphomicrobiaceae bacterium]
MSFERLFDPNAIAIIGASSDLTRISGQPITALKGAGFKKPIYLVNPKYGELHGLKCYPSAAAIGSPVDLALIAVPAKGVPDAIRDCGKAGIPFAIVLTAGFREGGAEGRKLEDELLRAARESNVRVIGPNCQGALSVPSRMWCVFGSVSQETQLREGPVSCAFQSGGFGYAVVNMAEAQGLGFRHVVSTGNETDITMPELLGEFLDDPGTKLAFAYMEGTPNARSLLDLGRKSLETGKPVFIWKGAQTESGTKAAASHTANMTGNYDLYRAAFRQSGLIEVQDVEEIVDVAKLALQGRLPKGRNIGVLSISGGSGIVFADRAVKDGLALPSFSQRSVEALKTVIPSFGAADNPADTTAGVFNDPGLFTKALDIILEDPAIDQLSILLASAGGKAIALAAQAIVAAAAKTDKPVHVAWSGRREKSEEAWQMFHEAGIPHMASPIRLAHAAAVLARYAEDRRRLLPRVAPTIEVPAGLELPAGAVTLSEIESKAILSRFGVPVTREVVVPPNGDFARLTANLTGPFAVKIVSRDIAHKTEAGGVKLKVAAEDLPQVANEIIASAQRYKPDALIDGVLVSEMASGVEALIGVVNDESFGPTVALGLGGVLTEVLKDVTFRIAPFDIETARDMIAELRGAKLFDGYRGSPPADREALAAMLVEVSRMAAALGDRLKEMDINPVFVRPKGQGCVAADALIVLK